MVPIYSIVSFLSYLFYRHAIYFAVIRDCYEAFAIASFFALMCSYIAPELHNQKDYFRGIQPRDWVLPLSWFKRCCGGGEKGCLRTPRSGLTWFNVSSSVGGWGMDMEITNATPDHLVWCLPVLLRAGFHDFRSTRHPNISPVLPGITQSSVCTYLGMYR